MCFLVGNDFLPQLPTLNIAEGALDTMLTLYKKLLPLFGGYLIENGNIVLERLEIFLSKLGLLERLIVNRRLEAIAQSKGRAPRMVDIGTSHDDIWGLGNDCNENTEETGIEPWTKEDIEQALNEAYVASTDPLMESIKKSYYRDKLNMDLEDKDSLEKLKFTYLKGLLWTWKYYYSGCPSWRWFYPYHYAPMASDLVGLTGVTNICDFSASEPFLPFQQLLAVLPPQSAWCLPTALQKLMNDKSSPIFRFYPSDFEVDMDGKRNAWEGVIKLPFVDESLLLEAYHSIPNELFSEEERNRNACRQTMIYRRHQMNENVKYIKRKIRSPFPNHLRDIEETAAICEPLSLPVVDGHHDGFEPHLFPGTSIGASSPGNYPTLKSLSFSIYYAKIGVNVFGIPSKRESVIIQPQTNHNQGSTTTFMYVVNGQSFFSPGKRVLVEYPWRCEALVWSVINCTGEKVSKQPGTSELFIHETVDPNFFIVQLEQFRKQALSRNALDIGEVQYMVGVHLCDKRDPTSGAIVSYCNEDIWLPVSVIVPIELSTRMKRKQGYITSTISELNRGDRVVYIGKGPHFGRTALVTGKIITNKDEQVTWFSLSNTAELLKSTTYAVSRITSSVFVKSSKSNDRPEDIGLRLKFVSKSLYVPGYCRLLTSSNSYEFSYSAIQVLLEYKQKFPQVFDILDNTFHDSSLQNVGSKYIDMGVNSEIVVTRIKEWLKSLELAKLPLLHSSSEVMSKEEIANVEQKLKRDQVQSLDEQFLVVPRELLLFGDEHEKQRNKTNLAGIQSLKENVCLKDRVVNISATGPVPFGFHGTVVGIHGTELEVVFDEPFPAGTDLHHRCPAYRGKTLSRNTVLKLHNSEKPLKSNSSDFSYSKISSHSGHDKMLRNQRSKRTMNVQTPTKPLFLDSFKHSLHSKPKKQSKADSWIESQLTHRLSQLLNDSSVQNESQLEEERDSRKKMTTPDNGDPVQIWEQLQEREHQTFQFKNKLNAKSPPYKKSYQRVYTWRRVKQPSSIEEKKDS
ncbi:5'-3' exoribonuclease 1 [Galdieria sulphuraria]|nr:5'-3' exoribonuclease 1 [Galdieria sulphuraria]